MPPTLRLHEEIGRGGQGTVHRATLRRGLGPAEEVAVKRLVDQADWTRIGRAVARLRDEAAALALLDHPTIPRFVGLWVVEGDLSLVTAYVPGVDLADLLRDGLSLPPRATAELVATVADALASAWSSPGPDGRPLQLVHRDLKPSNLRLDPQGRVSLLDFGLARSERVPRAARTTTVTVVGTPSYLAPERRVGAPPTARLDVFSLGLVGLEALGAPPVLPSAFEGHGAVHASPRAWAERVASRLREVPEAAGPLAALLAQMAAWSEPDRPDPAAVREAARELAPSLPGPDLATWAAAHVRPDARPPTRGRRVSVDRWTGTSRRPWARWFLPIAAGAAALAALALVPRAPVVPDAPHAEVAPPPTVPAARPAPRPEPQAAAVPAAIEAPAPSETPGGRPRIAAPPRPVAGADASPPRPAVEPPDASAALPPPPLPEERPRWSVRGSTRARLARGSERRPPGPVASGVWTVEADFGEGWVPAGEVTLPAGGAVEIACMPWLGLCEAVP